MKQELKNKRKLSYLMNSWNDANLPCETNWVNIGKQVEDFFKNGSELVYPAKSYFVAIVYAKCLEKYFGEDFYTSLNDIELLPDDKYFKTYCNDRVLYDSILERIGDIWQYDSIQKSVNYFKREFLVQ